MAKISGAEFKAQIKAGEPKFGVFLNSASPVLAAQFSHSGYDWLLIDAQHGPMDYRTMGHMISAIANGKAKSLVRVGGYQDRQGIQQALDLGADGVLIPYINNAAELKEAVSCCLYPMGGTRSVYFPGACTNAEGLLGYVPNANKNIMICFQVETHDCIKNIDEIMKVPNVDLAFLGQNDLCMSMGLYEKYVFPQMYTSPELKDATEKLKAAAAANGVSLGIFLFGTDRVGEFLAQGFNFVSIGSDIHHALTQAGTHVKNLVSIAEKNGKPWTHQPSAMI